MSESEDVRKSECPKVWMSESLNVWKSGCLKVRMSESEGVWSLDVSKSGCLKVWMSESRARKLGCHIFKCWNLKDVSHESFSFTSSTVGIWRTSPTKASLSHLQLLEFEGSLARNVFLQDRGCTKSCILQKTVSDDVWGSLSGRRLRNTLGFTGQWNCQFRLVLWTFLRVVLVWFTTQSLPIAAELTAQALFWRCSCA